MDRRSCSPPSSSLPARGVGAAVRTCAPSPLPEPVGPGPGGLRGAFHMACAFRGQTSRSAFPAASRSSNVIPLGNSITLDALCADNKVILFGKVSSP